MANSKTIEIGGETYTLEMPSRTGLMTEMERYVISCRGNPLLLAVEAVAALPKKTPAAVRDEIWKAASAALANYSTFATAVEIGRFEDSLRGMAWKFWQCLQTHHAETVLTVDAALELLNQLVEEHGEAKLKELGQTIASVTTEG